MESIVFAGAVFGMLWLCYAVYRADKNKNSESMLGVFVFKDKKNSLPKTSLKE